MTNPTDPSDQNPEPGPSPSSEQPQYSQPQYGQSPYSQPQYGQSPYSQPQYGQSPYAQPPFEPLSGPSHGTSPRSTRTKVLIAASVTVVVVAGAAVSFVAFRDKGSGAGSSTPQGAVTSVVSDLTRSDILGVLDHLPPGERNALRDSFVDEVNQLKRLKVLDKNADPGKVSGVQIQSSGLTFAPSDEVVNDHVRIVKVTGGTFTLNSDAASVPYTKDFLDAAFPDGAPSGRTSDTVDIAKEVKDSGEPVRIAVQKVGGKWYPSFMYTVVDSVNHDNGKANPTAADAVPAVGQGSPEDAVRELVDAAVKGDTEKAIEVLDPDDSAALHDYGKLLFSRSASRLDGVVRIDELSFTTTKVSGGTRVSLKSVTATDPEDDTKATVTIDGDCLKIESDGDDHRFCAADAIEELTDSDVELSAAEKTALDHLFSSLPKVGVVTTQSGGKWFVSPIRSYADLGTAILSGLGDNDLLVLIKLANRER